MISDKVALTEMLARLDVLPWALCCETGKRSRDTTDQFKVPHESMLKMIPKRLHPSVMEKTCLIKLFRDNAQKLNAKKLSPALKLFISQHSEPIKLVPPSIVLNDFVHIQTNLGEHVDKLLCLLDVARSRSVLTVCDVSDLGFKSIDHVTRQWFMLKQK